MFPSHNHWQDAGRSNNQMSGEDLQTLVNLAAKYGAVNLMFCLRSLGEPCECLTFSFSEPLDIRSSDTRELAFLSAGQSAPCTSY